MEMETIIIDFSCVDKFLSADPAITVVSMYEAYVRECSSNPKDMKVLVDALNYKMWEWHPSIQIDFNDMYELYHNLWEKACKIYQEM